MTFSKSIFKIQFSFKQAPALSMDASILIVGNPSFSTAVLKSIDSYTAFTVEVASDPNEAVPLIQAQQPDLLIAQARQSHCLELCHQVKAQSRLAWIYCILIDDRPLHQADFTGDVAVQVEEEIEALEAGADAYLCLPLNGVLSSQDTYQQLQIRWLQAQIQAGLRRVNNHRELMRTNDLLSAIALSDPLTELNNRRAFEWELPRQINNARSRDMPISLLMLDVDYFKTINDTYGHLVGDRALQLLSARIRYNLRFYDTPFRYGGEEFVIILSDTNAEEASLIANRLCNLIADQPFAIDNTLDLAITISAGTACLQPDDDIRGISLLQRADQNLLKAKSLGRNQVVSE
jgi:two-component system, cell cycle response regulator